MPQQQHGKALQKKKTIIIKLYGLSVFVKKSLNFQRVLHEDAQTIEFVYYCFFFNSMV